MWKHAFVAWLGLMWPETYLKSYIEKFAYMGNPTMRFQESQKCFWYWLNGGPRNSYMKLSATPGRPPAIVIQAR